MQRYLKVNARAAHVFSEDQVSVHCEDLLGGSRVLLLPVTLPWFSSCRGSFHALCRMAGSLNGEEFVPWHGQAWKEDSSTHVVKAWLLQRMKSLLDFEKVRFAPVNVHAVDSEVQEELGEPLLVGLWHGIQDARDAFICQSLQSFLP